MGDGVFRILHISDLHYGMWKNETRHVFCDAAGKPDPKVLVDFLIRDPACAPPPDVVVASGDLAWSGADDDYKYAEEFLRELRDKWPVPFVIAPGNHDVLRDGPPGTNRQIPFCRMLDRFHAAELPALYPLLAGEPAHTVARERLVAMAPVPPDVFIVAVNSAAFLEAEDTPVFVPRSILKDIGDELTRRSLAAETFRIFVMHHHLLPFVEGAWGKAVDVAHPPIGADPTLVANSAEIQTWLVRNGFSLVLHGHKHMPHVRRDILRRRLDKEDTLGLLIIGAGSAGVYGDEIPRDERNGYNVIRVSRLATRRWRVQWSARALNIAEKASVDDYSGNTEVGIRAPLWPNVFCAERMDDCHRAIAESCDTSKHLTNFLSVVETPDFRHPSTARIGSQMPTEQEVKDSFQVLHPEYDKHDGWIDAGKVHDALARLRPTYRFRHGPRLFGSPGYLPPANGSAGPVQRAVEAIEEHGTRAYAGLYHPQIDVLSSKEPIPALVGVQFIAEGRWLDVVATFRNLELSFWWVVNMYEIGKLLEWAALTHRGHEMQPRRITFFSPLAEWKVNPAPVFIAEIDSLPLSDLARIVLAGLGDQTAERKELGALLEQKRQFTSEGNLDPVGLQQIEQLSRAALALQSPQNSWAREVTNELTKVEATMREAIGAPDKRRALVGRLRDQLAAAIALLAKA